MDRKIKYLTEIERREIFELFKLQLDKEIRYIPTCDDAYKQAIEVNAAADAVKCWYAFHQQLKGLDRLFGIKAEENKEGGDV